MIDDGLTATPQNITNHVVDRVMALVDLLWQIPGTILGVGLGILFHELCHYFVGRISGGDPIFDRFWFGIPTQIDFRSPFDMSDFQTRVMGGIVVLWPMVTFAILGYILGTGASQLFPAVVFFAGASSVSWLDLLALAEPELWKKFTAGEAVSREQIT